MSLPELKLQGCEEGRMAAGSGRLAAGVLRRRLDALRWLSAAVLAAVALAAQATPARAQTPPAPTPTPYAPCPTEMMPGQPFVTVPEIAANQYGNLRGTIILGSEKRWVATRLPFQLANGKQDWAPANNSQSQCNTPEVRFFMGLNTVQFVMNEMGVVVSKPYPTPTPTDSQMHIPLPMPGPTLRARVGNLVELAFLNLIDPNNFGNSVDGNAERTRGGGCDESSFYPGGDRPFFPDCFHGSSTGNIHFHGTHTNPNATGDNVFIEVRPALREKGKLVDAPDKTDKWFDEFFTRCERELSLGFGGSSFLREWPTTWNDLPKGWTDYQLDQLEKYNDQLQKKYPKAGLSNLLKVDQNQLRENAWPQYYIGSYPYCFRLPEYTATTWPSSTPAPSPTPTQAGGAGTAELGHAGMGMGGGQFAADAGQGSQLLMGQAPGTHWYHAHKHGSTAINVANGMTGAFIIEGKYDDDLNTWYGKDWTRTQPLMVINQIGQTPNLMVNGGGQDKGPDFSINGRLRPVVTMTAGEVQMFRIVNTSGRAGVYFEGPPAGFEWKQLAQDGVQFSEDNYQNRLRNSPNLLLAAGNRADLLLKAPTAPCAKPDPDGGCSYPVTVKNVVDRSDTFPTLAPKIRWITLFTIKVKPDINGLATKYPHRTQFIPHAPSFPAFLQSITDDEIKGTKKVVFATGPGGGSAHPSMHTIDGKRFDGEVGEVVLLNTAEEWKIINESYPDTNQISHPFHIHINPFQVTEVFDPNEQLIDPTTKKPVFDPQKNPVPKYVFSKTGIRAGQCYLNPYNPSTWRSLTYKPAMPGKPAGCVPMTAADFDADNIWWDVFPIPSGVNTTFPTINPKTGKPNIDPKTGKPLVDPTTGLAETVNVPGYFKMRSRFVDYPGFYVIHCHILAHEDRGMMTIVEVAPVRTPYSHH
jgi:FtsP/CotA-like multicopper oxidase with cupredoxin domain